MIKQKMIFLRFFWVIPVSLEINSSAAGLIKAAVSRAGVMLKSF
jgi:hypothetical protein